MIRRQARLRREYIYRKSLEEKQKLLEDKRERFRKAIEENRPIPSDLRAEAVSLQKSLKWKDEGGEASVNSMDDEYRWAGVDDPKIMVTTSRDPSSRLKMFVKELKLLFPNTQRMNRGHYEMGNLVKACRANEITDFMMVTEHRGKPNGLIVCHLPYGPTAYFTLTNVVMRHDIPDVGTMSEQYPHIVMQNLDSPLGNRVKNILKYLFPVPKPDSRRVITFYNDNDFISFRHHTYKREGGKEIKLSEVGPRFEMQLYKIIRGTLDNVDAADVEWQLRPYMNTARKRQWLSTNVDLDD